MIRFRRKKKYYNNKWNKNEINSFTLMIPKQQQNYYLMWMSVIHPCRIHFFSNMLPIIFLIFVLKNKLLSDYLHNFPRALCLIQWDIFVYIDLLFSIRTRWLKKKRFCESFTNIHEYDKKNKQIKWERERWKKQFLIEKKMLVFIFVQKSHTYTTQNERRLAHAHTYKFLNWIKGCVRCIFLYHTEWNEWLLLSFILKLFHTYCNRKNKSRFIYFHCKAAAAAELESPSRIEPLWRS